MVVSTKQLPGSGPGKEKRGPGRPKKEIYHFKWTPEDVEIFKANAKIWKSDISKMDDFTDEALLVFHQMLYRFTLNPPPGRSGPAIVLQAMKDFRETAAILDAMRERREREAKKR